MSDSLVISGGAGGMGARLEHLRAEAAFLDGAGDEVRAWNGSVAEIAVSSDVTVAALLCPVEVAGVAAAVAAATIGPNGLLVVSGRMEASAVVLRASATTYEFVDATQQRVMEALQNAAGFALGVAVTGGGLMLLNGARIAISMPTTWPALVLLARNTDLTALKSNALDNLYANPWLTDSLTRMAPGMVQGTTWSLGSLLGGPVGGLALPYALSGGQWPTGSYEDAVAGLANAGGLFGMFQDLPGPGTSVDNVSPVHGDFHDQAPASVEDIFREQRSLGVEENHGQIQITKVEAASGTSWIVQVPGTQEWSPFRGTNPVDLTTNVRLMAGDPTVMQERVESAMRLAGIGPEDPVMLTGHSQGGITAAALASDPSFQDKFSVRSVVTGGSPIGRMDIPKGVSVLALEHEQDVVPMLDGRGNPDRSNWVTIQRALPESDYGVAEPLAPGTVAARGPNLMDAHDTAVYADTGRLIDDSSDPSVQRWREQQSTFFDGTAAAVSRWNVTR
jgi:hypothetical protein